MYLGPYITILLISFFSSFLLVPVVQRLAFRFDILDHPKSRKIHKRPMPKLGGLAMYLAFVVGVLANCD